MRPFTLLTRLLLTTSVQAAVTVYTTIPGVNGPTQTSSVAPVPQTTGNSAYSLLTLTPPAVPQGLQLSVPIQIPAAGGMTNLSVPQKGNFLGFSVELSVADAVLGRNSTFLSPIFLNYMANLKERTGMGPIVRVGGNSQDESLMYQDTFVDAFGHRKMIQKYRQPNSNPTQTPNINFAIELFYAMSNITSLVGIDWYFGLAFDQPFNDSNAMLVARAAESILGDHLVALQLGNEPDLYADHQRRPPTYSIQDYFGEFQHMVTDLEAQNLQSQKILLGPSVCCNWSTQQVLDAGYLTTFAAVMKIIGVMHYPNNNCGISGPVNPQDIIGTYLTHNAAKTFVSNYIGTAPSVMNAGLPFVILETNTASCGGFPGLSDAFGSALWAIDNALALAAMNFTTMLLHVGGQSDSYNPFTPPPTNLSMTHQWTTGPVYYSTLAVAETFGQTNKSQIVDLNLPSEFQPGYAIYEDGVPTRLALINFVTDPSGASTFNAVYSPQGGTVPDHVSVRYLSAASVSEKFAITWANQTLGSGILSSDGRLQGEEGTVTIPCDTAANTCTIPVYAPSFALVFLSDDARAHSSPATPTSTLTFATTAFTNANQHPMIDPSVLKTMNGEGGPGPRHTGSTTKGQGNNVLNAAVSALSVPALWSLFAVVAGLFLASLSSRLAI
ncbi:hypothetical protein FRB99_002468 [Tulasnella sp. 403]|nr:hypothetical protein FRB99_002468 [Tulasnella sp. 403]